MSRSYRKTPISGITTASSDKAFKKAEHRRARRKVNALDLTENDPPMSKQYGNPWAGEKDGKSWFDPQSRLELLRK